MLKSPDSRGLRGLRAISDVMPSHSTQSRIFIPVLFWLIYGLKTKRMQVFLYLRDSKHQNFDVRLHTAPRTKTGIRFKVPVLKSTNVMNFHRVTCSQIDVQRKNE